MNILKTNDAPSVNMLSVDAIIKGDIIIDGDFRLDGNLTGNIKCSGKILIGLSGCIEGEIECRNAEIFGKVIGNIIASDIVILKESSNFNGEILTTKLMVESGAILTVKCVTKPAIAGQPLDSVKDNLK